MATRRERKEARLQRRLEWASSRDKKATQSFGKAHTIADGIPFGQPILVGHHSEARARRDQDRIHNAMAKGAESTKMAERHRSVAGGIADQLAHSIFSDDDDAVEQLQARIADLEAERERIKAYNASCRKGARDSSMLTEKDKVDLLSVLTYAPYQSKNGAFPTYKLSYLNSNIKRNKDRLAELQLA